MTVAEHIAEAVADGLCFQCQLALDGLCGGSARVRECGSFERIAPAPSAGHEVEPTVTVSPAVADKWRGNAALPPRRRDPAILDLLGSAFAGREAVLARALSGFACALHGGPLSQEART